MMDDYCNLNFSTEFELTDVELNDDNYSVTPMATDMSAQDLKNLEMQAILEEAEEA